ncbi:MAG: helix-turn-helix domain-containing protein [Hyphomicrobiaceae bacterium]
MVFGDLIRQHRLELGLSQEELGHQANLHRTYISSVERGIRNPTITVLHRIANALDLTVSELLDGLEDD